LAAAERQRVEREAALQREADERPPGGFGARQQQRNASASNARRRCSVKRTSTPPGGFSRGGAVERQRVEREAALQREADERARQEALAAAAAERQRVEREAALQREADERARQEALRRRQQRNASASNASSTTA